MNPREISARFLLQSRCLLCLSVLLYLGSTPPQLGKVWKAIATGAAGVALGAAWVQRRQWEQYEPLGGVYSRHELSAYAQFLQTTTELGTAAVSGMWTTMDARAQAIAPVQEQPLLGPGPAPQSEWWPLFRNYPNVLIWGPAGSGKTTQAHRLVLDRVRMGHKIVVADPHWRKGEWNYPGVEVVGGGMDYVAVDGAIADFANTVDARYKERAATGKDRFEPITMVCEEFTHWASRCQASAEFLGIALSDTRKVDMAVIFVSHGRSLDCVGGKKGMAKTRDDSLLELKLLAIPDPTAPNGVRPAFKGMLKRPAIPEKDAELVATEQWSPPIMMSPVREAEAIVPTSEPLSNPFADELNSLLKLDEAVVVGRVEDEELLKVIQEFGEGKNVVTPSQLKANRRSLRALPTEAISLLLEKLAARGIGTLQGDDKGMKWQPPTISDNGDNLQ